MRMVTNILEAVITLLTCDHPPHLSNYGTAANRRFREYTSGGPAHIHNLQSYIVAGVYSSSLTRTSGLPLLEKQIITLKISAAAR